MADSLTLSVGDLHIGYWDGDRDRRDWRRHHARHYYRPGRRSRVTTVRHRYHYSWVYSDKRICRW